MVACCRQPLTRTLPLPSEYLLLRGFAAATFVNEGSVPSLIKFVIRLQIARHPNTISAIVDYDSTNSNTPKTEN